MPPAPSIEAREMRDLTDRLPRKPGYRSRPRLAIRYIVVHHVGGGVNRDYTALEIARYHIDANGWPGIGYHFLVHPTGQIDQVNQLETRSYHCRNLNGESVGMCLAGDFTEATPASEQIESVGRLVTELEVELGRELIVLGHGDVPSTSCPGATFESWRQLIRPRAVAPGLHG